MYEVWQGRVKDGGGSICGTLGCRKGDVTVNLEECPAHLTWAAHQQNFAFSFYLYFIGNIR